MSVEPIVVGVVLHEQGGTQRRVYFPRSGVLSVVTPLEDSGGIETATIGNEGMVGIQAFLGGGTTANARVVGQVPGTMIVVGADAFRAHANGDGKLRTIMLAYTQALFTQISQAVACNAAHEIQHRTAKWLLETHDRAGGSDTFILTQEFLAQMLGVTRPSVSVAARTLQQAGLIQYRRGEITVIDRAALEEAACECYAVVRREYERLLGPA
ncbi:MAG TPA: Crp/Fnr family transcriptional regulator [Actinomycetota bacterium]